MNAVDNANTQEKILIAGKEEFLTKGFKSASLRNIVKTAGVTTGAFYGYYASKEELFDALVKEPVDYFFEQFRKIQREFKELSPRRQEQDMGHTSRDWLMWFVDYMYDHFDAFKLLLCSSEGTRYENFIHDMVEIEIESTRDFMSVMRTAGKEIRDIDPQLEHILVSGMFSAVFEIVIHDLSRERAKKYIKELQLFNVAGWKKIMGL